ncbi:MAG TPA: murein biosynthesis integral membrane protein MurJ [candidate division WOR-3 bacterium]|uniref:Probable lipid II flippase MurJ n=1 Tax=candidate division WOR-3 bacterium TaxID=2052148 RepID=A0A9C9EN97_UNCW3|nr:murein biosynthesis integral membrane protein MurJ [candidate division WOR-3 bacterium]
MADIAKGVRAFTVGTAVSRVLGLIRESVFAYLFGAGMATDAFNAAFRIPNLFRDLFAETALSAAFIPVLTEEKQKGKEQQNLLASNVFNILLITAGIVVVAGIIFSPYIVRIVAFGFGSIPDKIDLTARLTAVIFPFLLFIAFAAWAMGYLNTEQEFFVPSLAPAFFNIFSIAVPVILFSYLVNQGVEPIFGMAIGVLLGGLMQFSVQLPMLFKKGFHYRFHLSFTDPNIKRIFKLFLPVAIGLAASRINVTVDTILISLLQERSMTWLNYAFRIMHLPLGLFGIAVGTVALPTLSQCVAAEDHTAVKETFFDSLKLVFFLTVYAGIIIAFLSYPITKIIYERGKFTPFDTWATTQALILYVIGIPFIAGIRNVAAVFYAYKDARTPMYASFAAVGVNIILNLILMRFIGFRAFPLSTTISSFLNLSILFYFLPGKIGGFKTAPLIKYFIFLLIASGAAGFLSLGLNKYLTTIIGLSFAGQAVTLLLSVVSSFILFYLICLMLGVKEVKDYIRRLTSMKK